MSNAENGREGLTAGQKIFLDKFLEERTPDLKERTPAQAATYDQAVAHFRDMVRDELHLDLSDINDYYALVAGACLASTIRGLIDPEGDETVSVKEATGSYSSTDFIKEVIAGLAPSVNDVS